MTDPFEIPSQLDNPGGPSNRQRNPSGNREDMTMSLWHRILPDVRGVDIDLCSVCPSCKEVTVVFEASTNPAKAVTYTRKLAKRLGVPAVRLIHAPHDYTRQQPIDARVYRHDGGAAMKANTWYGLTQIINGLHAEHECE